MLKRFLEKMFPPRYKLYASHDPYHEYDCDHTYQGEFDSVDDAYKFCEKWNERVFNLPEKEFMTLDECDDLLGWAEVYYKGELVSKELF